MTDYTNTSQPDNITGTALADSFSILTGSGAGNDVFFGFGGDDTAYGGTGDDFLDCGTGDNLIYGGFGDDIVTAADRSRLTTNQMFGGGGDDVLITSGGNDSLDGGIGIDTLQINFIKTGVVVDLGAGFHTVDLGARGTLQIVGFENVTTWSGADKVTGSAGPNLIVTNGGNDTISGQDGNDVMLGGGGNDVLYGGLGNDNMAGNAGHDTMSGGNGADEFAFLRASDSPVAHGDQINNFVPGQDIINMEGFLDMSGHVSNGPRICSFTFIGTAHFSGTGDEVRFQNGVLQADSDQNGQADFSVQMAGVAALTGLDFMFS